jgi:hypothetical protein
MSVAVYLRTRGLSASARSPVPALFLGRRSEWDMTRVLLGDHAPEFKNVRLTELCIVEQATSGWLWEVQLS